MFTYKLKLTGGEVSALAWIADRYQSASVLYDGMTYNSDLDTWEVSEPVAWEYADAINNEDGNFVVPPCCGGELADKLVRFYCEIV